MSWRTLFEGVITDGVVVRIYKRGEERRQLTNHIPQRNQTYLAMLQTNACYNSNDKAGINAITNELQKLGVERLIKPESGTEGRKHLARWGIEALQRRRCQQDNVAPPLFRHL